MTAASYDEGPWFYKRASLYYIVYAATRDREDQLRDQQRSDRALDRPRRHHGQSGSTFTNHPGVVDYKGHSYFFYHNGALPGGGDYKRSVCVEEFTYGADGSIPKIRMSTKGPPPSAT